jgi:DNA-directed RNA polymerase specialized sigma24 family protein
MFTDHQLDVLRTLIHGHATRLAGGPVPARFLDVRDVEQEAWLAVCQRQHRWDGVQKVQTFHYLRARGAMVDYLRTRLGRAARAGCRPRPTVVSLDAFADPDARGDIQTLACAPLPDLPLFCQQLLRVLPSQERTVIERHYFHDDDFAVLAHEWGLSPSRVSHIHTRALQRLRDHVTASAGRS